MTLQEQIINNTMGLIITLIVIGLVLIFAEILIIPGVGLAGFLGLASLGGSCCYAFVSMGTTAGLVVTGINLLLIVLLTIYVLRAKTWQRIALDTNIDSKATDPVMDIRLGDRGRTVTRLAPTGTVRREGYAFEARAIEGMIDPGVEVEVILIEDNKVYVRPLMNV